MHSYDKPHISNIYQFGDQFEIKNKLNAKNLLNDLAKFDDQWSQYNPRKDVNRQGLCVLNNTGIIGPGPALDSLYEYNREHNTDIGETDCNIPTELFYSSDILQANFGVMLPWICRTHFLRLGSGGFFPVHRDHKFGVQNSFRMIVPIKNCRPPKSFFIIENKILDWNHGSLYVVNTTKSHTLFNASMEDSIWLVINVVLCEESVEYICKNLSIS